MSPFQKNGATGYRVSYQPAALQSLKQFHDALSDDERVRFLAAMRAIHSRLRTDPQVFGEYRNPLIHMRLAMRAGAVRPLHVTYGVHTEQPCVVVTAFQLLPGRDSVTP
jgi:hypothetical protein